MLLSTIRQTLPSITIALHKQLCTCTCNNIQSAAYKCCKQYQKNCLLNNASRRLQTHLQTQTLHSKSSPETLEIIHRHSDVDNDMYKPFDEFDVNIGKEFSNKDFSPIFPSHSNSLAHFVNSSKTLQTLIMFEVNLFEVQKKHPESLDFLIKLKYPDDFKNKLSWLKSHGIVPAEMGAIITKNPYILDPQKSIEDLNDV